MNEFEVFTDERFGELRLTHINNRPYFCGVTVAMMLGFTEPRMTVENNCHDVEYIEYTISSGEAALEEDYSLPYISTADVIVLMSETPQPTNLFAFVDFFAEVIMSLY